MQNTDKLISVVMCTYNGAKYLKEQIDSILQQTIADFELVVCDDCSNDGTWEILQDYASSNDKIRVCRNERNLGFLKNYEKALGLASGEYVALSDQDDIWMPNHLEVLVNLLGDRTIACGNSLLVDENGDSLGMTLKEQEDLTVVSDNPMDVALSIMVYRNPFQGAAMLFRRSFLEKALPIPEGVKYHDSWFAALACFMEGISYTDEVILYYRMHGENLSGLHSKKSRGNILNKRYKGEYILDRPIMLEAIVNQKVVDSISKKRIAAWLKRYFNLNRDTQVGRMVNRVFFHRYRKAICSI